MRPLARPNPGSWTSPATLDLSRSRDVEVVERVFGTDQPHTARCLELLDDDVSGRRTLNPDESAVAEVIAGKVNSSYRSAAPHLIDALGEYCAYCGTPLDDMVSVEHVLPKSQYPTYALAWENLLPSCVGCNTRKRDQPLRSETADRLKVPVATPDQCHDDIRTRRYRWPDLDEVEGYFSVRLFMDDGGDWVPCPAESSVAPTTTYLSDSIVDGEVRAAVPAEGRDDVRVAAVVVAPAGDPRSRASVDLMKLARFPEPGGASDRRTVKRTIAWLRAVDVLNRVCFGGVPASLPPLVGMVVQGSGYWRTWVSVAAEIDSALGDLVASDTAGRFPGTDRRRLP